MSGILRIGTSGFAYPAWAPQFYSHGLRGDELLRFYAERLSACELNNTYYRQPSESTIRSWCARTPDSFRFAVKAQRGGSYRAFIGDDPAASVAWLTRPMSLFGQRLGTVLFRVPDEVQRDDRRLGALLAAWPSGVPITLELQNPTWQVDETFAALRGRSAVLCATELDTDPEPPTIRATGPFLYLRLRRTTYSSAELDAWAARLVPFLDAGLDAYAFFRHDATGLSPGRAIELAERVAARRLSERGPGRHDPEPDAPA